MDKKLYKYDGPVMDLNGKVRGQLCTYVHAYSKDQSLVLFRNQYLKKYGLTYRAGVKVKIDYVTEVS